MVFKNLCGRQYVVVERDFINKAIFLATEGPQGLLSDDGFVSMLGFKQPKTHPYLCYEVRGVLTKKIKKVTPFGGLGVGVFRQTSLPDQDYGAMAVVIVGFTVTIDVAVLRLDYHRMALSGDPLLEADSRLALGAGITF